MWRVAAKAVLLVATLISLPACASRFPPSGDAGAPRRWLPAEPQSHRVTFVQLTDPHLFDAGWPDAHAQARTSEAIDSRAAFYWSILEANRLISANVPIDFMVVTGDFGLDNVRMPDCHVPEKRCACPALRSAASDGPVEPIDMESAAREVAGALRASLLDRIYLLPGDHDLCGARQDDLHRWATFILLLRKALRAPNGARIGPQIVDLANSVSAVRATSACVAMLDDGIDRRQRADDLLRIGEIRLEALNAPYLALIQKDETVTAAAAATARSEIERVGAAVKPNGSYVVFAHAADVVREESSGQWLWKREATETTPTASALSTLWRTKVLSQPGVLGVFTGHIHDNRRNVYPAGLADAPMKTFASNKTFVAPPLSAAHARTVFEATGPRNTSREQAARGFLVVTATVDGAVAADAHWYSFADPKLPDASEPDLRQAREFERSQEWDSAASSFEKALKSTDPQVRASALTGYQHARQIMRDWRWWFPPARYALVQPERLAAPIGSAALVLLVALAATRVPTNRTCRRVALGLVRTRFRGQARLVVTTGAPTTGAQMNADLFASEIQFASERIDALLRRSRENWFVGGTPLLNPPAADLNEITKALGDVAPTPVDVGKILSSILAAIRFFAWQASVRGDFSAPAPMPTPIPAATSAPGIVRAFTTLRWGPVVERVWRVEEPATDAADLRLPALLVAAHIRGESLVR